MADSKKELVNELRRVLNTNLADVLSPFLLDQVVEGILGDFETELDWYDIEEAE